MSVIAAIILCAGGVQAQTGSETELREELGVARMLPVNPEAGQTISDPRPWIVADFSTLDREIDESSVQVLLDGRNITALCDINIQYSACELTDDLAPGGHDVIVTARDKQGASFPTLGWRFSIAMEGMAAVTEKEDRTTGRLMTRLESVDARFIPNPIIDVAGQFERPEGMNTELDFNFSNTSLGRTLTGSLNREVQSYGGLESDQGRISYFSSPDEGYEFDAGDFWDSWTPLSLKGARIRGVEYRDKTQWGTFAIMSGRSQDPSTTGSYIEYAGGATASWDTSASNNVTISGLTARELNQPGGIRGAWGRKLASIQDLWTVSDNFSVRGEIASVRVEEKGAEDEDSGAWELEAQYQATKWNLKARGFRYGTDFYPLAEGSSQLLTNDKRGLGAGLGFRPSRKWNLGGDYERYDALKDGKRTFEKDSEYLIFRPGTYIPALSLRRSVLSVSGAADNESETNLAMINWTLPGTKWTGESRLTALWQSVEFTGRLAAGNIETRSRQRSYSFNTNVLGRANVSWSRSDSSTVDRIASNRSKNRNEDYDLNLTLIPFKLLLDARLGLERSTGTTADTRRKERGLGVQWFLAEVWTFKLNFTKVNYTDRINPFYDYDQDLLKLEAERRF